MVRTVNSRTRRGRACSLWPLVGVLLIGYALFVAIRTYPLSAEGVPGGGLSLHHYLVFPPAALGGFLIGATVRRAYFPRTLRWQGLYVLGAVGGLTVIVLYLGLSPAWNGGEWKWYQQAIGASAVVGYVEWALRR